jgi:hypothetical protein
MIACVPILVRQLVANSIPAGFENRSERGSASGLFQSRNRSGSSFSEYVSELLK